MRNSIMRSLAVWTVALSLLGAACSGDETPNSSADAEEQLRDAVWKDDVDRAAALIEQGADVNAKDVTVQSAYLIAASEGRNRILDLALAHGAEVDDKDSYNGTALIRAAERGHAWITGRLLRAGIAKDHVNNLGWQAIHEAIWLGEDTPSYVDTVRILAAGGAELTRAAANESLTPLQMAERMGHPGQVAALRRALQAAPDDPNQTLLAAASAGDADTAALALRHGADIDVRDGQRRTPLLLAVTNDRVDVARLLVALGADPDALDARHDTPWLVTGVTGSVAMVDALLPADPDLTIVNRYGGVSVIPASERGHVEYVRRVASIGIDLNHVNNLGWTALLEAVILGDGGERHQQIVQILLDAGADPSIEDADGVSALEHARRRGFTEIARIIGG